MRTKYPLKAILSVLVLMGMAVGGFAAPSRNTPKNDKGEEAHPLYGGYNYKRITSTTEALACTGLCLLAEVHMQTGATGTTVKLRDTSTADGGGDIILKFKFITDTATSYQARVHKPLLFTNGISAEISSTGQGEEVTIFYLDLDR